MMKHRASQFKDIWLLLFQSILPQLDSGMQDVVTDVYSRSLKKMAAQPEPPAERIDDTLLI